MKDVMLSETPIEERESILRDNCDQILERSYTRKFDQSEINEKRAELVNVSIQMQELEQELAEHKATIKGKIKVKVSGVISTPFDWLEKRIDTVDQKKANILVDREKMTITLTVNEDDEYKKGVLSGSVEFSDSYLKLGINNPEAAFAPAKLGQLLRLNRGIFADKEECMRLVSVLKNFVANAKAEIQKQKDPSGSTADVYRCQVESNLPKSFTVNIPIFKGTAKQAIEVEFDHYLVNGEVLLQLVSPGANEVAEEYRDMCLDEVLAKIKNIAPDIAIMEV